MYKRQIKLKPEAGILATPKDIVENPKAIKVRELEAATLPRVLSPVSYTHLPMTVAEVAQGHAG